MSIEITALTPDELAVAEKQAMSEAYWLRVLIGLDTFINIILKGIPGETMSSRAARAATEGKRWGRAVSWFLDLFQADHGARAEAGDEQRAEDVLYLEGASGNIPTEPKEAA